MSVEREIFTWVFPLILLIMYLGLCHLVAYYIGARRAIGFGKTLLISLLFGPLIGLIVAKFSHRIEE